mmetsp:Transcript_114977/g.365337  ORF Transcript_114977/g.365337 Transcript_114977/m.365337 type:complete len:363 (-) Transcript_114977:335-1423(-)
MKLFRALALLLAALAGAQIDPRYAMNMTVYHLHPEITGAMPIDMDTGDVEGDLFFYLDEFLLPLECANASKGMSGFDCNNPERVDPNLVVSKVELEVDSRWTTYSACNLCNGTDPFSRKPCEKGTYICDCFGIWCNRGRVGKENITQKFVPPVTTTKCTESMNRTCGSARRTIGGCSACMARHSIELLFKDTCKARDMLGYCVGGSHHHFGDFCSADSEDWKCWRSNIPRKTGGFWYSTLKEGHCEANSVTGSCGWKIRSTTSVRNTCLRDRLMTTVEGAAQDCFGTCGPRNSTSPCWIGCFFDTVLGPKARNSTEVAGLPTDTLVSAFTRSFASQAQGGCPIIPDTHNLIDIASSWDGIVV